MSEYTATKDSGIEWIGAIPATWKTHTLYQLVTQVKNKNSDLQETNLLSLSYGKIKRRDINSNGGLLPESFNGYNIIEDGDIVLRLTDLQNDHTSLRVGLATERGIITSALSGGAEADAHPDQAQVPPHTPLSARLRRILPDTFIICCILLTSKKAFMVWGPVFDRD